MKSSAVVAPEASRKSHFLRTLGFAGGVVAVLVLLNVRGGQGRIREDIWFTPLAGEGSGRTVDAIFIGSSRVSAAIETRAFDEMLAQVLQRNVVSVNLGMGGSTTAEYAMGLRRLSELNPDALRGSVAFIEAPMGMADYQTWHDSWVVDQAPELMSRYLEPGDLSRFLLRSRTPFEQKAVVAADVLFGLEYNLPRLRRTFQGWLDKETLPWLSTLLPFPVDDGPPELASSGGILGDKKSVADARALAITTFAAQLVAQKPQRDWDSTTMCSVVLQLQQMGALPVFFDMPLSRTMAAVNLTPTRVQDRTSFREALQRWKAPYLDPRIATTEDDFPDIWHLRKSRSAEFTKDLTREFLDQFVLPAMRATSAAKSDSASKSR